MFDKGSQQKPGKANKGSRRSPQAEQLEKEALERYDKVPITEHVDRMIEQLEQELGGSPDLIVRRLRIGGASGMRAAVVYMQNMIDELRLDEFILLKLQREMGAHNQEDEAVPGSSPAYMASFVKEQLLSIGIVKDVETFKQLFEELFFGYALIFLEGSKKALAANITGGERRSVDEPKLEQALRGSREGFVESLRVNVSMVRRKIRSPKLWMEQMTIGELTQTPVAIMYIKGLADEDVLTELRSRLDAIRIDGILESNYIEEIISDQKWSVFPTIYNNERPDVAAACLLEGRIVIMVDGTPIALIIPAGLNMMFQAADDYYYSFYMSSFLRMLRFISFVFALLMPSVYVAITGYHQEMIPTPLLLKLAAQNEGVPFPPYLEAFIMEFVFEILREAVLRMPGVAGNAISIVGGLVIGQSVVEAGIVSSAVVIVVSFTAIASFVTPVYNLGISARLLRFLLLFAASTVGFYGIALVTLFLLLHLSNLKSFGMPYLKPFAPFFWSNIKDTFIRAPLWLMKTRPEKLGESNEVRADIQMKPREEPPQ